MKLHLLLEQDGAEAGVEGAHTFLLQHLAEATDQTVGICGLGDETDTGSLKRAEGDIGEEFGGGGGGQVDAGSVVGGILDTESVDGLLLEELVTSELESALEEVAGEGRANTSQQRTGTLAGNDLAEATNQTAVVGDGVELNSCLDAVCKKCQQQVLPSRARIQGDRRWRR